MPAVRATKPEVVVNRSQGRMASRSETAIDGRHFRP
jgi:hypothetical protein